MRARVVLLLEIILAVLLGSFACAATGQERLSQPPHPRPFRQHLADYDAELRRPDGRVDIDGMVARLKELGVTTYYWLIWHASTDWDDLKLFLPKAGEAGIDVWVYLVPPSESPPQFSTLYSEPFRLDYYRWAEEIARLSLQHTNLTAWVIDDFYANHEFFTPAYLREMQARTQRINPRLAFLPLMYFDEIRPKFAEEYREVIDGVVVAYLQDREEIEWTWAILNDAAVVPPGEISYPWDTPSQAGDFVMVSQAAQVLPADRYALSFRQCDNFTGPTAGYHFKQLLVDGAVVWDQDVAGGSPAWQKVTVDVTEQVRGKPGVTVALRLLDKKGVSNFGVRWHLSELRAENLQLGAEPAQWKVDRQGAFETGFGGEVKAGQRRFHIPFVSMTAGDIREFRQRHGEPATPERVADYLRVSLQAWRDGQCDGVVTYCLDKRPQSRTFAPARDLFHEFRTAEKRASQFVLVNRTPGSGGGPGRPTPISVEGFQEVKHAVPDVPGAGIRIGIGYIFSYLQAKDDASLLASLRNVLQLADQTDTPVLIQIDGEQWWRARPDLWNWWDPSRPGFDPANRENVEWSGWTPEQALKIAWRNWGKQLRVLPPPNLMSPRYRQVCHEKMAMMIPVVLDWWKALPAAQKDLLVGIKVGWESSIGVNAWYYPEGNALVARPADEDPTGGIKGEMPPARGVAPIGYAAVKTAGLRKAGELTEADLAEVARRHLEDLSREAARLGVPRDRLFTHGAGWKEEELLYRAAVNQFSCPGWSFYRHAADPRQDSGVQAALKGSDAPWWAATEWLLPGPREVGLWRQALGNTLADRKCRYLCIYNWEGIRDSEPVLEAIRQTIAASANPR